MRHTVRGATLEEVQARLERELKRHDGKIRRLAIEIAGGAGANPETVRRAIYRLLDGTVPEPATSQMLEKGLGKAIGYFTVAQPPAARAGARDRLGALEAEVAEIQEALGLARSAYAALLERVEELEAAAPRRGRARQAASTPGGAGK